MIVVFIYCLFLFFLVLPFGILTERIIKINYKNPVVTQLLGLGFLAVIFSVISVFCRLNYEVFLCVIFCCVLLFLNQKKQIKQYFRNLKNEWNSLGKYYKFLFGSLILLVCLKSAGTPFIIDNESYYIQTIKWINEYGLVKGLGNLHIFFAQTSGWHILQAGLNFSFLSNRINDINAFLFIVCGFFYLCEFQKNRKNKNLNWVGFVFIFNVLLFQFVDSPSPDLPAFLISPVVLYFFIKDKNEEDGLKISVFLFLFLVIIKLTILPLGLLFLFWIKTRKQFLYTVFTGVIFGLTLILKNSIISGYPFYPFNFMALDVDWSVPESLRYFIGNVTRKAGYSEHKLNLSNVSYYEKFGLWFSRLGINGLFNKGILVLIFLIPFTKSFQNSKPFRLVYLVLVVQFVLVFVTSPQYRFFLISVIFFSAVLINEFIGFAKLKTDLSGYVVAAGIFLPVFFLFQVKLSVLTNNVRHSELGKFEIHQILYPAPNSKYYNMKYERVQEGNLIYNSPKENVFYYGTYNGDLPCVNKIYLHRIAKKYKVYPQKRGKDLKDGFYSVGLIKD